ncbi:hypothetical protein A9299_09990 [Moraxella osloensis]|uniref:Uncharacterized protein n=1 Tax=Faucicola osloensis TaxID=34062 RepID=A0AA91FJ00_FAUOS|nr:hypothetical protein [Moraxella osloensis]OBX64327.1 hypothetical protein A9299_09990 [Moraxella osloensis]
MKFGIIERIKIKLRSRQITDTHSLIWEVIDRNSELAIEQRKILITFLEAQGYRGTNVFILKRSKKDIVRDSLFLVQEQLTNVKQRHNQEIETDKEIYTLGLLLHSIEQYINK